MKKYCSLKEVRGQTCIKIEGSLVARATEEHGLSEQTIYNWFGTEANRPTCGAFTRHQRENIELKKLLNARSAGRYIGNSYVSAPNLPRRLERKPRLLKGIFLRTRNELY